MLWNFKFLTSYQKRLMRFFVLFFLASASYQVFSQTSFTEKTVKCSKVMSDLSYYWKLDSVANNGFRQVTRMSLLTCELDTVSKDFLMAQLGKPNKVWVNNHITEYVYFYYDYSTMPKELDPYSVPHDCWYISFKFNEKDKFLIDREVWYFPR